MDDRGIVIFMVDEKMSPAVGKQLLKVLLVWLLQSFTLIFANIFDSGLHLIYYKKSSIMPSVKDTFLPPC